MYNLIIPGARFYNQLDAALTHNDIIEAELSKEIESARLFRLLTKLCTVVDRAELNGDFGWAEYGDRYMLKLFRDYIFHQVCSLIRLNFSLRFIFKWSSWFFVQNKYEKTHCSMWDCQDKYQILLCLLGIDEVQDKFLT